MQLYFDSMHTESSLNTLLVYSEWENLKSFVSLVNGNKITFNSVTISSYKSYFQFTTIILYIISHISQSHDMIIFAYQLLSQDCDHITVLKVQDWYKQSFQARCPQSHLSVHMQAKAMPCWKWPADHLHIIQICLYILNI